MTITRTHVFAAVFVCAAFFLLLGPGAAEAKRPTPCWKVLINDWYDGRIDGTYAIPCYRQALTHLPKDVQEYSSARDDIKQALQKRITQKVSNKGGKTGNGPTSTGGDDGGDQSGVPGGVPGGGDDKGDKGGKGGPGNTNGPGPGDGSDRNATGGRNDPDSIIPGAGSADSVPVPLIVLGSLAALLMAAGAAGFVLRRTRARRLQLASAAAVGKRPGESPPAQ